MLLHQMIPFVNWSKAASTRAYNNTQKYSVTVDVEIIASHLQFNETVIFSLQVCLFLQYVLLNTSSWTALLVSFIHSPHLLFLLLTVEQTFCSYIPLIAVYDCFPLFFSLIKEVHHRYRLHQYAAHIFCYICTICSCSWMLYKLLISTYYCFTFPKYCTN